MSKRVELNNAPLNTVYVISEAVLRANHSTDAEKN